MNKDRIIRLSGENIGAFKSFEIALPSITLVAGENGAGKSTISKSLYMLLNVENNVAFLLENEKKLLFEALNKIKRSNLVYDIDESESRLKSIDGKNFDALDNALKNIIIKRLVNAEFNTQAIRNGAKSGVLELIVEGSYEVSLVLSVEEEKNDLTFKIQNDSNVVYLESSTFMDVISASNKSIINHHNATSKLLLDSNKDVDADFISLFDEIDRNRMVKKFNEKLHGIIKGSFEYDKQTKTYWYYTKSSRYSLDNVASGIKAFSAIDLLIKYGVIKDDSVIILDEPENNLHPLWQVKYAELLVSLVKDTDIRLIINSHSPFFIEAIELNCHKILKDADYKFYFTELSDNGTSKVRDVTMDSAPIYDSLAAPYAIMDKLWSRI